MMTKADSKCPLISAIDQQAVGSARALQKFGVQNSLYQYAHQPLWRYAQHDTDWLHGQ
jgi:hypothetical protein